MFISGNGRMDRREGRRDGGTEEDMKLVLVIYLLMGVWADGEM